MAQPLKGKEVRQVVSIRIEPSHKEFLIVRFGSVQAAIDYFIKKATRSKTKEKANGEA